MPEPTPPRHVRTYKVTAEVEISTAADLSDPFNRSETFLEFVRCLKAADLSFNTPHGRATVAIGLVTAWA